MRLYLIMVSLAACFTGYLLREFVAANLGGDFTYIEDLAGKSVERYDYISIVITFVGMMVPVLIAVTMFYFFMRLVLIALGAISLRPGKGRDHSR